MYKIKFIRKISDVLLIAVLLAAFQPAFISLGASYNPVNLDKANALKSLKLFLGTNQGFMLDEGVNRAMGAVTVVRLLGKENEATASLYTHPFKDVPSWANPHVGYLYHYGLTNGSSKTTYGSNDAMTAAQFTSFLLRALGYDDKSGDFKWDKAIDKALEIGLYTQPQAQTLKSKTIFLRDDMVGAAYSTLTTYIKGTETSLIEKLISDGAVDKTTAITLGLYREDTSVPVSTSKLLHGFYPAYVKLDEATSASIDGFDTVSLAWVKLEYSNDVKLNTTKAQNGNYDFYFPADSLKVLEYLNNKNIPAQLSIFGDGLKDLEKLLPYQTARDKAVNDIVKLITQPVALPNGASFSYNGAVIDFENMHDTYQGTTRLINGKPISYYYNLFLDSLRKGLDTSGKKLYTAVQPISFNDGYDYRHIISTSDKVILMIHDYALRINVTKSEITKYIDYDVKKQPINTLAPINSVKINLEYAKSKMTSKEDIGKLMLQVSFGSRQWSFKVNSASSWALMDAASSSTGIDFPDYSAIKDCIANTEGATAYLKYNYITGLESPYLTWYNTKDSTYNFLLYEDSRSIAAKVKAAESVGINSISVWRIGNIPNYDGNIAADYHLDVWQSLLQLFGK